jgi:hypothetical protein
MSWQPADVLMALAALIPAILIQRDQLFLTLAAIPGWREPSLFSLLKAVQP